MLINRSEPQPRSRKTPRGGRMMARMILQMSLNIKLAKSLAMPESCAISSWGKREEVMYADPPRRLSSENKESSGTTRQGIFNVPGGKSHSGECFDGTMWCFGDEVLISWRVECLFVVEALRTMRTDGRCLSEGRGAKMLIMYEAISGVWERRR